jgi:hypothetical protein
LHDRTALIRKTKYLPKQADVQPTHTGSPFFGSTHSHLEKYLDNSKFLAFMGMGVTDVKRKKRSGRDWLVSQFEHLLF